MNKSELEIVGKLVKGFFSEMQPTQRTIILDGIQAFNLNRTCAAVRSYAANHTILSVSEFLDFVRAAETEGQQRQEDHNNLRIAGWLRQEAYRAGKSFPDDPADAVFAHFSHCWETIRDDPTLPKEGVSKVRNMILGHSFVAFRELNLDVEIARKFSQMCIGLKEGEKLNSPALDPAGSVGILQMA